MKDTVKKYLKENIDDEVVIEKYLELGKFPLVLIEKYIFYNADILNYKCIFVEELTESSSIVEMKKHMKLIMKKTDLNVVFLFKTISQYRRKSMLKDRIPFVVENGQIYLPFLGLDLSLETKKRLSTSNTFMPISQMIYLYFLYNENLQINATELAKLISISQMHAVRGLNNLYELGLLTYTIGGKTGRSKYYKRIPDPTYYQIGKEYLKSPVMKVEYLLIDDTNYPYAGIDALSKISMVNPPRQKRKAISKNVAKKYKSKFIHDIDKIKNEVLVELEIWEYDPVFLADNGIVDILSLAISLRNLNDERVEKAIDECLEGEVWYME